MNIYKKQISITQKVEYLQVGFKENSNAFLITLIPCL